MRVDWGEMQIQELAEAPRPFRALYEHWERHQWSPFAIDFSTDAASFAALDEQTRDGLVSVFAHRFQAEFNVAALLAPFLLAAPDYDVQLLLATQVADEHRHIESVLRVYSDVFAVEGGIAAVKARRGQLPEGRDRLSLDRGRVDWACEPELRRGAVRAGRLVPRPACGAAARRAGRSAPHRHR